MDIYELLWFFIFYAFCGWVVEVIYAAVNYGKFVNRGFLNGPVCPIYGFGIVAVVWTLEPLKENVFILYIGSIVLTSLLEFITGYFMNKIFRSRWWDYSKEPFNIGGYICLKFSLLWGIACVLILNTIHPLVVNLVKYFRSGFGYIILIVVIFIMLIDTLDTAASILKIKKRLKNITEIAYKIHKFSDGIGETIAEGAVGMYEKKDEYEKNKQKYQELLENKLRGKRLFKAFPDMVPSKYKEAFEELKKAIERKKNK